MTGSRLKMIQMFIFRITAAFASLYPALRALGSATDSSRDSAVTVEPPINSIINTNGQTQMQNITACKS